MLDAITRNPNLAEAYISLGWIQFAYEWKLKDAEESYRKAIKLNPKIPQAHQWLGLNLQTQGRLEEAHQSLMRGLALDPNHLVINANLCMNTFSTGKLVESEEYAKKTLNINASFFDSWFFLYMIYLQAGDKEKEIAALIDEIKGIPNKNSPIYSVLLHYYKERDTKKMEEYYKLAIDYNDTVNNTALQDSLLVKIGFDDYMELAESAYANNTLPFNFELNLFMREYRDQPKYKAFVEKIRKGK